MTLFYDARGNIYGVVSPAFLRTRGIDVPISAADAARARMAWAASAIAANVSGARRHALRRPGSPLRWAAGRTVPGRATV
jgi:hypothetical protein